MEKVDIKAHLDMLAILIDALDSATNPPDKVNLFVSIRTLLADLDDVADANEYRSDSIGEALAEIEMNCQAIAGLMPSRKQDDGQHVLLAKNDLNKLAQAEW